MKYFPMGGIDMLKKFLNSKREQTEKNYITANGVPNKYSLYMYDMNFVYSKMENDSDLIVGRSKEIARIQNAFLRNKKKNVVLVGEHGVGKSAIVQKLVTNVLKGRCPEELKTVHFFYLDVETILFRIEDKKMQKLFEEMINYIISFDNIVVVIDQMHLVETELILATQFALLVKIPHVKLIGMTTEEEFEEFLAFDQKSKLRLEMIRVEEPRARSIYHMTRKIIKEYASYHKVKISEEMVKYVIAVSRAFSTELCNPELTLDIIEKSMVYAKTHGEKTVTRKAVNSNFNFNYYLYNRIPKEDKERVAYHEAGHYIVQKFSNIKNFKTTAITIVPAEDFLGVTSFEFEQEKQILMDMDYYVDWIAVDLGGRVAEGIYTGYGNDTNKYSSGAESDLASATATAREIVTSYGMSSSFGENTSYLGTNSIIDLYLLSEEIKNQIDSETKKLIQQGAERATAILENNIPLLKRIARELLTNDVLVECDLERICNEIAAQRNN